MNRQVLSVLVAAFAAAACTDTGTGPETVVLPVFSHTTDHIGTNFRTHMTGAEEVPARDTRSQGQAIFKLSEDGLSVDYKLVVANLHNVNQAHIHIGAAGANGPVVVWLYPAAPPATLIEGRFSGVLGEGTFTAADLRGTLAGQTIAALMTHIRNGNAYVNAHTLLYPGGEIRGQID